VAVRCWLAAARFIRTIVECPAESARLTGVLIHQAAVGFDCNRLRDSVQAALPAVWAKVFPVEPGSAVVDSRTVPILLFMPVLAKHPKSTSFPASL
jgi:hypothetical protein